MMMKKFKVLIVDDDFIVRSSLEDHLREIGSVEKVVHAENGKRGLARIREEDYDIVFLDIDLPMMTGMEVLRESVLIAPHLKYILMTAYGRIPDAVEALKLGAFTYLEKPLRSQAVEGILSEISEAMQLIQSVKNLSPLVFEKGRELIGKTPEIQSVLNLILRLARVQTPILIHGESGTGKELVARAVHFNSERKSQAFTTVNCSAIPETLFESEFFGHEKGSFTGAEEKKIGKFQYAEGGTLFLDEIGDLSLANQVKLLRALQERKYTPLGSNKEFSFDVRIVAATHKNLEEMVQKGSFRQDLYFRLNVMMMTLPSLKERRKDVPELIKVFIEKFNKKHSRKVLGCKPKYLEALLDYGFPGNIRELENVIERGFVLSDGDWLSYDSLPSQILNKAHAPVAATAVEKQLSQEVEVHDLVPEIKIKSEDLDFQKNKEDFEKQFILEALKRNQGRLNQTALQANIPKKTLQRKIQKYGINVSDFKKK